MMTPSMTPNHMGVSSVTNVTNVTNTTDTAIKVGIPKMTNDILVNESDKFFGLSENSISTCYGAIASIVLAAVQLSEYSNGWVSNNICRICGRNHNVLVISLENGGHIVTLPHPKDRATKVKSSGSMLLPDIFCRIGVISKCPL
jgi:hypothetical protein